MDKELQKTWNLVETFLRNARSELDVGPMSAEVSELLAEFDGYLSHNELELALDALTDVGKLTSARGRFWHSLSQAARLMELGEKAAELEYIFVQEASGSLEQAMKEPRCWKKDG
jgi:hypothetical protein